MSTSSPERERELPRLIAKGESAILELKRSTGELREAMQTLCAFANGKGGRVVIGVKPTGELVGQQVSDQTLHELAYRALVLFPCAARPFHLAVTGWAGADQENRFTWPIWESQPHPTQ